MDDIFLICGEDIDVRVEFKSEFPSSITLLKKGPRRNYSPVSRLKKNSYLNWIQQRIQKSPQKLSCNIKDLPLNNLTPFQKKVYLFLLRSKAGSTYTYGQIAKAIGHPQAARAVGSALRKNPLPLLVPCHRVLPSQGGLGSFTGAQGSHTKALLLEQEGIKTF